MMFAMMGGCWEAAGRLMSGHVRGILGLGLGCALQAGGRLLLKGFYVQALRGTRHVVGRAVVGRGCS